MLSPCRPAILCLGESPLHWRPVNDREPFSTDPAPAHSCDQRHLALLEIEADTTRKLLRAVLQRERERSELRNNPDQEGPGHAA